MSVTAEICNLFKLNSYISIYNSGKGYLLASQRVLNDSCEPESWYIQRADEKIQFIQYSEFHATNLQLNKLHNKTLLKQVSVMVPLMSFLS